MSAPDRVAPTPEPIDAVAATELWYGSTGYDVASGLRGCNWRVSEVDLGYFAFAGRSITQKLLRRAVLPFLRRRYNRAIIEAFERTGARVLITVKGNFISAATLVELGRRGIVRLVYYPDYHFDHPGVDEQNFEHFELIFTTKSFQIDTLSRIAGADRVVFLHHGYSSLVAPSVAALAPAKLWDVCFVGNASPHKFEYLKAVAAKLPSIRMLVVGNGWKIADGTPLKRAVLGYPLMGDFLPRLVAHSQISLAIHFGRHPGTGWEDLVSRRTFEIPAYGGFMLHIDNPEVRDLYEIPAEVATFTSPDDLADKVAAYLADPVAIEAAGRAAKARANPAYSLAHRARMIDALVRRRFFEAKS